MDTALKTAEARDFTSIFRSMSWSNWDAQWNNIQANITYNISEINLKKNKPDDIGCFQISSNLCDKWEKNIFLNVIFATF